MTAVTTRCPACGADLVFRQGGAIVQVCAYCRSVVARGDRTVEDLGKIAEVVDTGSPLRLGLRGRVAGPAPSSAGREAAAGGDAGEFELVGRAQIAHAAGGRWDEWYAAFTDGRWGWLAEAQGRLYLTFEEKNAGPLPALESLIAGEPVPAIVGLRMESARAGDWIVAEKGVGRAVAAEGEMPFRLVPGAEWPYADLSGPDRRFATIDYSEDAPLFYTGREVTPEELGIDRAAVIAPEARPEQAVELRCPNCHGPLALRAPDEAQRVTCPHCRGLLDASQGALAYLQALEPPDVEPEIPLGVQGELEGRRYAVLGYMRRSVEEDGERFGWSEYLLHAPGAGFRWLVKAYDGAWSFVVPLGPGEVRERGDAIVERAGASFRHKETGAARVDHVLGEFYWRVSVGETVEASDFERGDETLSRERTTDEVTWSHGRRIEWAAIAKAFGLEQAARPVDTKLSEDDAAIRRWWWRLLVVTVAVWLIVVFTRSGRVAYERTFELGPATGARATTTGTGTAAADELLAAAGIPVPKPAAPTGSPPSDATPDPDSANTRTFFTDPFPLRAWQNIVVTVDAPVENSWFSVAADLIHDESGAVRSFELPIEYYHGYEGGESWSEGGRSKSVTLAAPTAGNYTLRLECQWDPKYMPPGFVVRVEQGAWNGWHLVICLIGVSIIPLLRRRKR